MWPHWPVLALVVITKPGACVDIRSYWNNAGLTLQQVPWIGVNDRASLETGLKCSKCMLSLKVQNGTEWLHIGGDLDNFVPIVTSPSQSVATSDLTLEFALNRIKDQRKHSDSLGIFIDLTSLSSLNQTVTILSSIFNDTLHDFPILMSIKFTYLPDEDETQYSATNFLDLLKENIPFVTGVIGWETYHGMDQVWRRIEDEGLLLNFQLLRIVGLIDQLYQKPMVISQEEVRFVQVLHRKLELANPQSFTFIALEQLLKALDANGNRVLESTSIKKPRYRQRHSRLSVGPIREVLSDYYIVKSSYPAEIIDQMRRIQGNENYKSVGFSLRAGLITNSSDISRLKSAKCAVADEASKCFFVISREPSDRETASVVTTFLEAVGEENVFLDSVLNEEMIEEQNRIPQPKLNSDSNDSLSKNTSILISICSSVVLFFFTKYII